MTYNYSATQNNGRIVGSVDGITGENTAYTYDALNRLTSATAAGMWSETYAYDGFGNLTGKTGTGGAPSMTAIQRRPCLTIFALDKLTVQRVFSYLPI